MATWIPESASPSPIAAGRSFGLAGIGAAIVREPVALLGLALVALYVAVALVVGFLPLRDPLQVSTQRLIGPTPEFPFGTDALGRDVLSRVLFGARLSIRVAVLSVAIATIVGGALGLISGYLGGWADLAIGRVLDVFFAFPAILLALGIVAALGPDPSNVIIAIAVVYTPIFARVVRGPVLALRARDLVAHRGPPRPAEPDVDAPRAGQPRPFVGGADRGCAVIPRPFGAAARAV